MLKPKPLTIAVSVIVIWFATALYFSRIKPWIIPYRTPEDISAGDPVAVHGIGGIFGNKTQECLACSDPFVSPYDNRQRIFVACNSSSIATSVLTRSVNLIPGAPFPSFSSRCRKN